jgi:hypothetical protein
MFRSVLLVLVALFDFGGPPLEERVREEVAEERRAAALEVVGRIGELEARLSEEIDAVTAAFAEVHRDHDAGIAAYEQVLDGFDVTRRELTAELLGARGDLRRAVTAAEWKDVFDTIWRF